MTELKRRNRGTGHSYTLDGVPVPGVTTVLGVLSKPGLTDWSARLAAEYAVDHWTELAEQSTSSRLHAIRTAYRDTAPRVRGTRIHTYAALVAAGTAVDVPDELAAPVDAYARFLDTWQMEPVATECPCCHVGFGYAGTFDAIVSAPKLGTVILDIKTGGVYREAALQLAAYRYATHYLDTGVLETMPDLDGAYVARVGTDDVELVPMAADADAFNAFLYLLGVYRWTTDAGAEAIGNSLFPEDVAV